MTVASAQVRKPCAVSRKKTSWTCTATHLVRSRPVRKPPIAAASHCTTIRPIAVMIVNVAADAPEFGQGEIEDRPRPAPSANSTSVIDTAANAPEKIAAQLTADCDDSLVIAPPPANGGRSIPVTGSTFSARSGQEG